ncbi:hypothetical protein JXA34_04060 [Patescibacteria group bacterium]|nr:hypothetical protein [Patescibacteria group bacterium]
MLKIPISYSVLPHIYPDSSEIKVKDIQIPFDIKDLIDKTENVIRFADERYQMKGMVPDNTKTHTIRCVLRAKSKFPKNTDLQRRLWIHDIPEIVADVDENAVSRFNNQVLAEEQNDKEFSFAATIFNDSDLSLYKDFIRAERLLSNRSLDYPESENSMLAKIIDTIDGNLVYTYFFVRWLKENDYNGSVPPESVFKYASAFYKLASSMVRMSDYSSGFKSAAQNLLDDQLKISLTLWEKLDEERIPPKMKEQLEYIEKLLN